jgi:phosphoglycerol transferase MdoB-like AlkP superfamily enzyme
MIFCLKNCYKLTFLLWLTISVIECKCTERNINAFFGDSIEIISVKPSKLLLSGKDKKVSFSLKFKIINKIPKSHFFSFYVLGKDRIPKSENIYDHPNVLSFIDLIEINDTKISQLPCNIPIKAKIEIPIPSQAPFGSYEVCMFIFPTSGCELQNIAMASKIMPDKLKLFDFIIEEKKKKINVFFGDSIKVCEVSNSKLLVSQYDKKISFYIKMKFDDFLPSDRSISFYILSKDPIETSSEIGGFERDRILTFVDIFPSAFGKILRGKIKKYKIEIKLPAKVPLGCYEVSTFVYPSLGYEITPSVNISQIMPDKIKLFDFRYYEGSYFVDIARNLFIENKTYLVILVILLMIFYFFKKTNNFLSFLCFFSFWSLFLIWSTELAIVLFTKNNYCISVIPFNQVLEYFLMFSFMLLIYCLTNSEFLSLLVPTIFCFIFSLTNILKIKFLNEPFYLCDVEIWRNGVISAAEILRFKLTVIIVMATILLFFLWKISKKIRICKLSFLKRVFAIVISISFLLFFISFSSKSIKEFYNYFENHYNNGFLVSFLHYGYKFYSSKVKVSGYNKEVVQRIKDKLNIEKKVVSQKIKQTEKMDIIVVLLEAFWDAKKLGINFNKNFIPYFNYLQSKHLSTEYISPVMAGNTAVVEFQVLTGLPKIGFLQGSPYFYIKNNLYSSLPYLLRFNGFNTISIHPYYSWFYGREKVFPKLGFTEMYWQKDFKNPSFTRWYISDESFFDKIIELVEKYKDQNNFIYAVSIALHGPYLGHFKRRDIFIVDKLEDNEIKDEVEEYVNLLHLTDKAIEKFISYFEKRKKKTLIVLFGDHIPALYKTFRKISVNDKQKVPIVFWTNFDFDYEIKNPLEAHMIGNVILHLIGVKNSFYILKEKVFYTNELTNEDFKLISYDIIFGKRYFYQSEYEYNQ